MKIKLFIIAFGLALSLGILSPTQGLYAALPVPPVDNPADCNALGGQCQDDPNCYQYAGNKPPGSVEFLGVCDGATQNKACCGIKPIAAAPGSDLYCTNTLKGNCVQKTQTCGSKAVKVGDCTTDTAGVQRICCQTLPGAQITGPMVAPYSLLEKIPGSSNTVGSLNTYLEDIYRFAFWAVGIAVVFMLTIGGFMYLTSAGNTSRLGTAKTIIFDAFLGLILALVAWLFLNLINPNLVDLALPTTSVITPPPPPTDTGGTSSTLAGVLKTTPGVTVSSAGDCKLDATTPVSPDLSLQQSADGVPVNHCQKDCPSTGYCLGQTTLSATMLSALIEVASLYPFTITSFTGGNHSGNSSHYSGRAVDIKPAVSVPKSDWPKIQTYLRSQGTNKARLVICDIWDAVQKKNVGINCDDPRTDHIHAEW